MKGTASSFFAFQANISTEASEYFFANSKSDTRPLVALLIMKSFKHFKNPIVVRRINADTIVFYTDTMMAILLRVADINFGL